MRLRFALSVAAAVGVSSAAWAAPTTIYDPVRGLSYYQNGTALNYADAEAAAVAQGGHLVSIHSDAQNAAVIGIGGAGWIGLNDRAVEGTYVWTDGSPTDYTHWNSGEPNDFGGAEDATEFNGGNWNDNNQANQQGSVYQKPGITYTFNAATNKNYAVIATTDWNTAESQAVSLGGHLVSIHSAAENAFVQGLIPNGQGSVWIGLNDKAAEGSFVWTDGTPVDYTNWNPGEPNDSGGAEDVAELGTGTTTSWNDNNETQSRFAVIEVPVPEPTAAGLLALGGIGLLRRRRR